MTTLILPAGALICAFAFWTLVRGTRRPKAGPANNWRNEDYASREADGTWAEGATYSKSPSHDSTGLHL